MIRSRPFSARGGRQALSQAGRVADEASAPATRVGDAPEGTTRAYRDRIIRRRAVVILDRVGMTTDEIALSTGYHVEVVRRILREAKKPHPTIGPTGSGD